MNQRLASPQLPVLPGFAKSFPDAQAELFAPQSARSNLALDFFNSICGTRLEHVEHAMILHRTTRKDVMPTRVDIMKQGSILSYLQPKTTTPDKENNSIQTPVQTTLQAIVNEKAASDIPESQENKITSNVDSRIIVNTPDISITSTVKLRDPRASVTKVFPSHVDRLKSITSTLLPVRYSDRFFAECLELDNCSVLAYTCLFDSKPVGWIRCRLEPFPAPENPVYQQIYIQTLGVLAPYRGMGLASALLDAVISSRCDARSIYAHVWETNEDALEWYDKHAFQRVLLVPQYYRRLRPGGAWLVRKGLT